ncbi:vesicular inhibitory amino acid transporter-like [Anneissia japonica]|uniref:vesicular inhibitory amino acid transporter-like n=1 Tax=Anneissia japonica TaxID=1529436 RepID=UPI0014259C89|nr:vesicular inhibitory amino acid transporter-like [Anneissia japonica]
MSFSMDLRFFRRILPSYSDEETVNFAKADQIEMMTQKVNGTADMKHSEPDTPNGHLPSYDSGVSLGQSTSNTGTPVRKPISTWDAGWNVTNAIQGMFLVALPYAVLHGGYWSLFFLLFAAVITCYTGLLLVECLYDVDPVTGEKIRVRETYVEIAQEVWGARFAARIVYTAQFIELIMTCILYLVLCGDLMDSTIKTSFPLKSWTIICCFFVLPCAFLINLKAVSRLSFGCTVAHIIINVVILGYCLTKANNWQWKEVDYRISIHDFPVSLGIVIFSYTSHIFLPTLEGSMSNRGEFKKMMYWTHAAAGFFKMLFAYLCFLVWGRDTSDVITENLTSEMFKGFVNIFLVIKALLSYPLPYYAAVELLERALFQGMPTTPFPSCFAQDGYLHVWALFLRSLPIVFTLVLAIYIPHFGVLMGLIGSFTGTMLSFVWPCWFHLKIKWDVTPWYYKVFHILIMITGAACGSIGRV